MSTRSRKANICGEKSAAGALRMTTLPPSVSRLSIQCVILNISQPYRPPWPVTGTASMSSILYPCFNYELKKENAGNATAHTADKPMTTILVCVERIIYKGL
jgi:hypothetical protein